MNAIRNFRKLLPVLVIALSLIAGVKSADAQQRFDSKSTVQKFAALLQMINYYYVDSTNQSQLTEHAVVAMLKELDPHSVYISKDELQKANEPLQGNFEGVGIQFQLFHGVEGAPVRAAGTEYRRPGGQGIGAFRGYLPAEYTPYAADG